MRHRIWTAARKASARACSLQRYWSRCCWCHIAYQRSDAARGRLQSEHPHTRNPPWTPLQQRFGPAYNAHPRPDVAWCCVPFCSTYRLVAINRVGSMGMNLDGAGIDHEPLKVRLLDHLLQQLLPDSRIAPAVEATMRILPVPVIGRPIKPRGSSAKYPKTAFRKRRLSKECHQTRQFYL